MLSDDKNTLEYNIVKIADFGLSSLAAVEYQATVSLDHCFGPLSLILITGLVPCSAAVVKHGATVGNHLCSVSWIPDRSIGAVLCIRCRVSQAQSFHMHQKQTICDRVSFLLPGWEQRVLHLSCTPPA